ncbi:MAG: phage protein Gp36 family protein [Vulcanimicrobiota bacterium]
MAYSTGADVRGQLPALPAETTSLLTDAMIASGIEYADQIIDAYLGGRYSVPFSPVPKLVKHISADLASAFVLDSCFSGGGEDDETPLSDTIRKRAMDLLKQLASGDLKLPVEAPDEQVVSGDSLAYHTRLGQTLAIDGLCY